MSKVLRVPPEDQLPEGPGRWFVQELFVHYRDASRPTLEELSAWIRDNNDLKGTASRETIRRVFNGKTVPRKWSTVEAILLALCARTGRQPTDRRFTPRGSLGRDPRTIEEVLRWQWNRALDGDDSDFEGLPPRELDDPWANAPAVGSFNDEPPF